MAGRPLVPRMRAWLGATEPYPRVADVSLDPVRFVCAVFVCCVLADIGFVLLDYHVNYGRLIDVGAIRRLSNIAREDGLASWFGTAQTLLAALTLWLVYAVVRSQRAPAWRRAGWLVLALLFSYMTVDDGAQLHERIGTLFDVMTEDSSSTVGMFPSYTWQVLFGPAFGLLGLFMLAFLWLELSRAGWKALVVAALACLAVAVGLDFVEGLDPDHPWNLYAWIDQRYDFEEFTLQRFDRTQYAALEHFSRSIEEFLEMLANTFLWVVFLHHLTVVAQDLRVRFTRAPARH